MPDGVVLFYTIHDLFRLDDGLKQRGVDVKAIPAPRELSSDCGSALRFDISDLETVQAVVRDLRLHVQGIHEL